MKAAVAGRALVKASGGVRDLATALAMVEAGADRIGTSSGVAIVRELAERARRAAKSGEAPIPAAAWPRNPELGVFPDTHLGYIGHA
jgi:hypothetical protein